MNFLMKDDQEVDSDTCNNEKKNSEKVLMYPVDTVGYNGKITTESISISAAGSLGNVSGKSAFHQLLLQSCIHFIGVGVTESGLNSASNQCMKDLTWILYELYRHSEDTEEKKICVVNTDNVPQNGDVIQWHMLENTHLYQEDATADSKKISFVDFLETRVVFLNSMVDRITSARMDSKGMIPSCEPLPEKALVICDPGNDLPDWMREEEVQKKFGVRVYYILLLYQIIDDVVIDYLLSHSCVAAIQVKIRHQPNELSNDISLKLRVANGTHTALAHAMALSSHPNTDTLSSTPFLLYLDDLYVTQILPAALNDGIDETETNNTWLDWRQRVQHPHFGLSTFFITQNGAAKGGIRFGPTVKALVDGAIDENQVNTCNSDSMCEFLDVSRNLAHVSILVSEEKSSQCIHGICLCRNHTLFISCH